MNKKVNANTSSTTSNGGGGGGGTMLRPNLNCANSSGSARKRISLTFSTYFFFKIYDI